MKKLLAALIIPAISSESFACSVCSVTNEAARYAYYATTALLTLLPLLMIGGVVYYIAKKDR
jgi:hypothetical protein